MVSVVLSVPSHSETAFDVGSVRTLSPLQADKAQLFRAPPSLSGSHGMGSVAGRPGAWPALVSPQKTMQE